MKHATLILLLLWSAACMAQVSTQTVRGKVIDKQAQFPIPGVKVEIPQSSGEPMLGVTDMDGKFRIESVPTGRQTVIFTSLGYEPAVMSNIEVNPSKEVVLNIEMEETVVVQKEITVTAEKDPGEVNNDLATVSSRTFSIGESKRYAGSLNDVSRMARNFAGVQGSDDSRNDIVIRGNSPIGVLYRLEGVDIPNPNHFAISGTTGGPVSILNNNVLANSDFMTSAFPAEYGNAMSGVFDLKMRNGNNEKHEFLGQIGFNGLELMAEGPLSKKSGASYLVSYRYSTLELFEVMGLNFGTAAIPEYQDVSFKLNFPHKKGSFHIFGLGGLSFVELLESETDSTDLFAIGGTDTRFRSNMGAVGMGQTLLLDKKTYLRWSYAVSGNYSRILQDSISTFNSEPIDYYRQNSVRGRHTFSVFVNRKFSARHVLKVGTFVNRMFFNLADSVYQEPLDQFVTLSDFDGGTFLVQPYAQWQYRPTNDLTFTAGAHYAYFQRSNSHSVEPRAGMRYQIGERHTLSAGYGMHSQLSPTDVYFNRVRLANGNSVIPNKGLDFTKAHHAVIGYDFRIGPSMRFKTEAYYQHLYDVPVDVNMNSYSMLNQGAAFGVAFPDSLQNAGSGRNYGMEFTLEHFLKDGFYFLLTASIYDSKYTGSDGIERNTAFAGNYVANLLGGKEFELNKNNENRKNKMFLLIDGRVTYQGGNRYTPILLDESIAAGQTVRDTENAFSEKFPDYFRADLKLGFKVYGKRITQEWSVDLQNITNRQNLFTRDFDASSGRIYNTYQIGFLPIVLYRINF